MFCPSIVTCLKNIEPELAECALCHRTVYMMNVRHPWPVAIFRHGKMFENRKVAVSQKHKLPMLVLVIASVTRPSIAERNKFFKKTGLTFNRNEPHGALVGAVCFDKCLSIHDPQMRKLFRTFPSVAKWMDGPFLWHMSEKYEFDIHLNGVQGGQTTIRFLKNHPQRQQILDHLQFELADK